MLADPRYRRLAELHSRTREHAARVERARHLIADALAVMRAPHVALSGGKDSTVVMALVLEQQPGAPAVWSDGAWWLPETERYIERRLAAGWDVHRRRRIDDPAGDHRYAEWFVTSGPKRMDYVRQQGWDGVFLGLRAEESRERRLHLGSRGPLTRHSSGLWHCSPIDVWTWRDVWAFILVRELDYNEAYDRMAQIGVEPMAMRIGPFATDKALGRGQIAMLRRGWPSEFNRFAARHPEARGHT